MQCLSLIFLEAAFVLCAFALAAFAIGSSAYTGITASASVCAIISVGLSLYDVYKAK